MKTGIGYDVHKLVPDESLVLGGVEIEHPKGLSGHSDADVLVHAVIDSLLGAAGAGDIGRLFPDTDPEYAGISSLALLEEVTELIEKKGFIVNNLDGIIVAEKPKLASHLSTMEENISQIISIEKDQINLKATTTEGLGFIGHEKGISAQVIASIKESGN